MESSSSEYFVHIAFPMLSGIFMLEKATVEDELLEQKMYFS